MELRRWIGFADLRKYLPKELGKTSFGNGAVYEPHWGVFRRKIAEERPINPVGHNNEFLAWSPKQPIEKVGHELRHDEHTVHAIVKQPTRLPPP